MLIKKISTAILLFAIVCFPPGCSTTEPSPAQKTLEYESLVGTWKPILVQTSKEYDKEIPTHYLVFTTSGMMQRIKISDDGPRIQERTVGLRENGVLVAQMSEESEMFAPIARVRVEEGKMIVQGAVDEILIYERISSSTDIESLDLKGENLPVQ